MQQGARIGKRSEHQPRFADAPPAAGHRPCPAPSNRALHGGELCLTDGEQKLVAAIRKANPGKEPVPIICLTGYHHRTGGGVTKD